MTATSPGSAAVRGRPTGDGTGDADHRGLPPGGHPPDSSGRRPGRRRPALVMVLAVVVVAGAVAVAVAVADSGSPPGAGTSASTVESPANPALAASPDGTELDPTMFEPGSCVAFSPTSGDRHQTVFLDAGHGGIDPGASGVTESGAAIHEADETLPVELEAAALLRTQGYRVVVSRTRASTVLRPGSGDVATGIFTLRGEHDDVAARDVCANLAKATVLLGIYFDAGTSSTDAGSVTGYDTVRPFSADNQRLATLLQSDVLAHLNARGWTIPNDGVVSDATLGGPAQTTTAATYDHLLLLGPADPGWFTTPSQMPGALIEPLFITDPFEGTIASSPRGQQAIAEGIAQAAEQYLGQGSTRISAAEHPT